MPQLPNDISNPMDVLQGEMASPEIAMPMNINEPMMPVGTSQSFPPQVAMGGLDMTGQASQQQNVMPENGLFSPPMTSDNVNGIPFEEFTSSVKKELKIKVSEEKILGIVQDDKRIALDYYNSELRDRFYDYEEQFEGIPEYYNSSRFRMPESCYVSKDMMVTIRAVVPDIMKLLLVKDPVDITGRTEEDVVKSQKLQALCNWQLTRLNPFFTIASTAINEALLKGISVAKVTWIKEGETRVITEAIHEQELYELEASGAKIKRSEFLGEDDLGAIYFCEYEADVIVKNQPKIEILPSVEFLFDPTANTIQEAKYCIHRKLVTKDFLKRKEMEGIYSNVDDIKTLATSYTEDEEDLYRVEHGYRPDDNRMSDDARSSVVINEYWGKLDVNDDGLLENVVVTFCGNTILSIEENTFDMYPFFVFSPFPSAFRVYGMGIAETIESIQTAKTAFMREMLDNTRRNNDRKIFYRESAFNAPSQMNDPHEKYVSINDKTQLTDVVMSEPFEQLSPNILQTIEYLDKIRQMVTGVSELKQGIQSQKNASATEANIRFEATNSQVQMMAVNFSYTFKDIYEFLVYANQKFIDEKTVIRLLNESIEIDPEDLQGVFDFNVACSIGTGTSESRRIALNNILLTLIQVAEPRGLTNPNKIRNILARIIEEGGMKDVDSFLLSEQELMEQQQQQMMQQQQMQMMQQQAQQVEIDNAKAKTAQEEMKALGMQDMQEGTGAMPNDMASGLNISNGELRNI